MRRVFFAVAILAVAFKLATSFLPNSGFTACYRVLAGPMNSTCEKSYDDPWADGRTRVDDVISFGSRVNVDQPPSSLSDSNWTISGINSNDFNFIEGVDPSQPSRNRLPIAVTWTGPIDADGGITIRYVGDVAVTVDGRTTKSPTAYATPFELEVAAEGVSVLQMDYSWNPQPDAEGVPYASISVLSSNGMPLRALSPPAWQIALGYGSFILTLLLTVLGLWALISAILPSRVALAFVVAAPVVAVVVGRATLTPREIPLVIAGSLVAGCLLRLAASRRVAAIAMSLVIPLLCLGIVRASSGSAFGTVTYRGGGDDFLTYESFARAILERGDFQGGEDVFVYSPAIRYLLYGEHIIFGDPDSFIFTSWLAALLLAVLLAVEVLVFSRLTTSPLPALSDVDWPPGNWRRVVVQSLAAAGAVALLFTYVSLQEVGGNASTLLSEFPTWTLLCVTFPLVIYASRPTLIAVTSAGLGLMVAFRANQSLAIGVMLIFLVARLALHPSTRRSARHAVVTLTAAVLPFFAIALLPAAHNWVYGETFALVAQTLDVGGTYPLKPQRLLDLATDPAVAAMLKSQVAGVIVEPRLDQMASVSDAFGQLVRLIQVVLILLLVVGAFKHFSGPWRTASMILIPILFLLPHIFVQVYVYYPRHVVAGYLAGALAIVALAGSLLQEAVRPQDPAIDSGTPREPNNSAARAAKWKDR
jgi:hypothetical protein